MIEDKKENKQETKKEEKKEEKSIDISKVVGVEGNTLIIE